MPLPFAKMWQPTPATGASKLWTAWQPAPASAFGSFALRLDNALDQLPLRREALAGAALLGALLLALAYLGLSCLKRQKSQWDRILDWAQPRIKTVSAEQVHPLLQGKPVCVHGQTRTSSPLRDDATGLEFEDCVALRREVEVYGWIEHKHTTRIEKPGPSRVPPRRSATPSTAKEANKEAKEYEYVTSYTYSQGWSSHPQSSSTMHEPHHRNPEMFMKGGFKAASQVCLGAFKLDESLVAQLSKKCEPCELRDQNIGGRNMRVVKPGVLQSGSAWMPEVGDVRIKLTKVSCGPATVASIQNSVSFRPLTADLVPVEAGKPTPASVDLSKPSEKPGAPAMHHLAEGRRSGSAMVAILRYKHGHAYFAIVLCWLMAVLGSVLVVLVPAVVLKCAMAEFYVMGMVWVRAALLLLRSFRGSA